MPEYKTIIDRALKDGGMLDALLALQSREGYVSEDALTALAETLDVEPTDLYDSASFYSMLRFAPPCPLTVRVCRGTGCHSAGNEELMTKLEEITGVKAGETDPEGKVDLDWVECLGQCGQAPAMLVNGRLHTEVDPEKAAQLLEGN